MEKTQVKEWNKFYQEMVDRNIGVISPQEQERLRNTCIAVGGCGGMGGLSAEQIVRLGVGHVKIADFDKFETHNLSRQCCSTTRTVGQHKAKVLSRYLKDINPELKIDVFEDGVQAENAEEFTDGAAAIIDGIDYSCLYNKVMLARSARKRNLCVVDASAIAFGVSILVFGPKTRSLEEYVGLPAAASREAIEKHKIPLGKFAPHLPSYIDPIAAIRVASGKIKNIPNIIMPQHLGTAIGVSEAVLMVLGRVKEPPGPNPRVFIIDLQDRKFEITD